MAERLLLDDVLAAGDLLRNMLDPVFVVDEALRVLFSNRPFAQFVGLSPRKVERAGVCRACLHLDICETDCILLRAKAAGKTVTLREVGGTGPDGGKLSIAYCATPLYARDGAFAGALLNFQDKSVEASIHGKYRGLFDALERSFEETLRVFAGIIELRNPEMARRSKRTAILARAVAERMGLQADEVRDVEIATMLAHLGEIGLPDEVLAKTARERSAVEEEQYRRYPVMGQVSLGSIEALERVGGFIRHHRERVDGRGFPDGLAGDAIPLGARIVAVADGYYDALARQESAVGRSQAIQTLRTHSGVRFDPEVVRHLIGHLEGHEAFVRRMTVAPIPLDELRPGMRLAVDLRTGRGLLLLAQDEVVSPLAMKKIFNFHQVDPILAEVQIYREATGEEEATGEAVDVAPLDAAATAAGGDAMVATPRAPRWSRSVLIVEDNLHVRTLLVTILRSAGYVVHAAEDGLVGLEVLARETIDAIVLDLMLPGVDGLEFARRVRAVPDTRVIPILMCTSRRDRASVARAIEAGADDYIAKPFQVQKVIEKLARLIAEGRRDGS